jgi:hypothetical protein
MAQDYHHGVRVVEAQAVDGRCTVNGTTADRKKPLIGAD